MYHGYQRCKKGKQNSLIWKFRTKASSPWLAGLLALWWTQCPQWAVEWIRITRSLYVNEAHNTLMTRLGTQEIVLPLECTGLFKIWTKIFFAREKTVKVREIRVVLLNILTIFLMLHNIISLAFWRLCLRNTRTGTCTPACRHQKRVILNKCPQLGIWSARSFIFYSTLNSQNLEMGTNGTEISREIKFSRKRGNYWISAKQTIQPKLPEGKSNLGQNSR